MATTTLNCTPRPYEASDLMSLKRSELLELVERQRSCWPEDVPLNTKTNKTQLRTVLLDRRHGFTTMQPRVQTCFHGDIDYDPFAQLIEQLRPQSPTTASPPLPQPSARMETQAQFLPPVGNNNSQQRFLHVYVEDTRFMPTFKSSADIVVNVENTFRGDQGQGVWYVSSRALVSKLQESTCRITGPGLVRIGTADPLDPEFTQFFVEAPVIEMTSAPMNPSSLVISDSPAPTLVLRIAGQHINRFETQFLPDTSYNDVSSASNVHRSLRLTPKEFKHVVTKLVTIATSRTGYTIFCRSKNTVVQNPAIPPLWNFAARFWEDFYKKDCDMVLGEAALAGKLITAECIYDALKIRSSAVQQAIEGNRLVERYTGIGEDFDAEVAREIAAIRDPPRGRQKLLEFLREREIDHSSQSRSSSAA